jgi:O-antigen ligase/polysaccharide polymerase Wzy-like membrane protein
MPGLSLLLAMSAALVGLVFTVLNFRWGVKMVLVLVVVEGALRKWVFPEAQQVLYFAKDIILVAALFGYFKDKRRRIVIPRPVLFLMAATAIIATAGLFNPSLPSFLLGLIGLKAYVLYSLLLILVPATFANLAELETSIRRYVMLAFPTTMLAMIQFRQPNTSLWNRYSNEGGESAAVFGKLNLVRVTSSFPYISGYTTFLIVIAIAVLGLLSVRRFSFRGNYLLYAAGTAALAGMPMTGSRGPIYTFAIAVPLFLLLLTLRGTMKPAIAIRALIACSVITASLSYLASTSINAFIERVEGPSDESGRIYTPLYQALDAADEIGVIGYGTGSTHNAAAVIVPNMPTYVWLGSAAFRYEDETARIILELGTIGLMIVMALRIVLTWLAFRAFIRARDTRAQSIAAAIFVFFALHLVTSIIFNPTMGVYYWFAAGIVVMLSQPQTVPSNASTQANVERRSDRASWAPTLAPDGIRTP